MVRATFVRILVGIVVAGAAAGCGKDTAAPVVAPNAPAGKVIEVSGKVSATRQGTPRVLAAGNEVFSDDTIETASDGAVVIELTHNHARWSLDGSLTARVDQSVAWSLAMQDTPAGSVEHATSAAGRNAERQGADTKTTTESAAATTGAPAAQPVAPVSPPPDPTNQPPPRRAITAKQQATTDQDEERTPERQRRGVVGAAAGGGGGGKLATPGTLGGAGAGADGRPDGATRIPGDLVAVRALLDGRRAALVACLDATASPLTVVVRLTNGAPQLAFPGGKPAAAVQACLDRVIHKLAFPTIDGASTIELVK